MEQFWLPRSEFARVSVLIDHMLCKSQQQIIDRLHNDEIATLVLLNAKIVEPSELVALPRSQRDYKRYIDACDSTLAAYCNQRNLTGLTNQLDICPG